MEKQSRKIAVQRKAGSRGSGATPPGKGAPPPPPRVRRTLTDDRAKAIVEALDYKARSGTISLRIGGSIAEPIVIVNPSRCDG